MKARTLGILSVLLLMFAVIDIGCRPYRRGLEVDIDIHSKGYHKHHDDHDNDHDDRGHHRGHRDRNGHWEKD